MPILAGGSPPSLSFSFASLPREDCEAENTMTKKRRSGGRNKPAGARGHVKRVRCESSAAMVPKDKAIKRFVVRNIVDASALRDIQDAAAFEGYALPKIYRKVYYSISAAIHSRIVRVRSRKDRRNREPPRFIRGGAAGGMRGGLQRPGGAGPQ